MVEGAEKAREIQHAAAVETRAWLEQARKSLQSASAPTDVAALQGRFFMDSLSRAAQYWSQLAANSRATQSRLLALGMGAAAAAPALAPGADPQAMTSIIDTGYKLWLDALQRLYGTAAAR
jgi:hypothetical protein